MSFWEELYKKKKIVAGLSPMDGVTDAPMRYMTARYGAPEVLFTEFVSVDALHFATGERRERLLKTFIRAQDVDLHSRSVGVLHSGSVGDRHWPYEVAQVFGTKPDLFKEAAELIESFGFDGIDINMGCPAHKVEENGSGAGLIRTPKLAQEIVLATKEVTNLPVSVKTRIGVGSVDEMEGWIEALCEVKPANISLHGRTLRQLYQGSADWEAIGRAGRIVHKYGGHILGNGDVISLQDGMDKVKQYEVDGFLIGRVAEGNPGVFLQGSVPCKICGLQGTEPCMHTRLTWMVEHAQIFETIFPDNFVPMRKHLAWYCRGFEGAGEMRGKLMMTNSAREVKEVVERKI